MSLRIIAGELKGRIIPSPPGDATRPTTDMWRSTIFSALEHLVSDPSYTALDLFCGTGSLGLEALSRGAASCTFVDQSAKVARALESLVDDLDVSDRASMHQMKLFSSSVLPSGPFGVIFCDAPYNLRAGTAIMHLVMKQQLLGSGGLLVIEHGTSEFITPEAPFQTVWNKEKGDTVVDILRWNPSEP